MNEQETWEWLRYEIDADIWETLHASVTERDAKIGQLRKALNDAAGTGLIMYHVVSKHVGRARDCQDIGCGLQRRTMEGFVGGPIVWGD